MVVVRSTNPRLDKISRFWLARRWFFSAEVKAAAPLGKGSAGSASPAGKQSKAHST